MKRFFLWIYHHAGLVIVLMFLAVHLIIINDYGLTWDYHFHFFGGGKLLGYSWQQLEPRNLPYVEPDPRPADTLPYGPLMSIPPVASFLLLYRAWHILPADAAYNLPIILWGVAGIGILYIFMNQAFSRRVAIFAALFLALTPRYFGDLHNNMKDPPSAVAFALNIWLLWRLVTFKRPIDLLLAVLAFAVAFNVKINSIYIPVVFVAWIIVRGDIPFRSIVTALASKITFKKNSTDLDDARTTVRRPQHVALLLIYFLFAPLAAFLLWWFFWPDPIGQLKLAYSTFGIGTNNIEVLLNGKWFCSGSTVPWYYPWWYLGITTPLPLIIFSIVGLCYGIIATGKEIFAGCKRTAVPKKFLIPGAKTDTIVLLILWLFLPLTRYFIPTIGVIDGIRHFEEVVFPIAALAAVSLDVVITMFRQAKIRLMDIALLIGIFAWLTSNIVAYHPYEITYFNELVGGAKGAFGKYDLDYWGTSQKAAILWVNAHAPKNAKVHIVMAAAVAATYLRPDLLPNLNKFGYDQSDFVVFLNRQSFYYRFYYSYEYLLAHRPAHIVNFRGVPLTWVFDNRTNNSIPRQSPWWQGSDPCIQKYW